MGDVSGPFAVPGGAAGRSPNRVESDAARAPRDGGVFVSRILTLMATARLSGAGRQPMARGGRAVRPRDENPELRTFASSPRRIRQVLREVRLAVRVERLRAAPWIDVIDNKSLHPLLTVAACGDAYETFLVIDSVTNETSSGGVRIAEDIAVEEIGALAREMTYKYTLFRLPRGGAKMGIRLSDRLDAEEKLAALKGVGRKLGPIIRQGVYCPGMDMNCGPAELRAIYAGAGIEIGEPTDTSFFTALSVENAVEACYEELQLRGRATIAIEGFGRVAGYLAGRLPPERYQITAVSTLRGAVRDRDGFDGRVLCDKRSAVGDDVVAQMGGEAIAAADVFAEPIDILIPSSRTWTITPVLAEQVRARAVVPIANAPYADGAVDVLARQGVVCLPGCVTNAGGVFGSSLFDRGLRSEEIEALVVDHYRPVVCRLVSRARELGLPCTEVATRLAVMLLAQRNGPPRAHGLASKLRWRLRQRMPKRLRARAARRAYVENMRALWSDVDRFRI
jgi:glutamate dehydrogenase (NAD(P)+)